MKSIKGLLFAIVSSATFGLIPLFAIPAIQAGVALNSVLFYRFFISAAVVGVILLFRKTDLRITLKEFITVFILGFFYAGTCLLYTSPSPRD